jgi:hypothetical protein
VAAKDAKVTARALGIWSPRASQWVLGGAGAASWVIAIALAVAPEAEAVATAFVIAGAPLIAAAAFYARVRKVGREGVEVDPLLEDVRKLGESLPPLAEDVSALEERRGVIEAVEAVVATPPVLEVSDDSLDYLLAPVDRGVQSYERAMRLERAAGEWLARAGFSAEPPAADRGVDFVARHDEDGGVYAFEVKSSRNGGGAPTPEALHSFFRQARVWADENLGQGEGFYRVLITDVVPPPNLRHRYRREGIGIVRISPDDGDADWVLRPKNVR